MIDVFAIKSSAAVAIRLLGLLWPRLRSFVRSLRLANGHEQLEIESLDFIYGIGMDYKRTPIIFRRTCCSGVCPLF